MQKQLRYVEFAGIPCKLHLEQNAFGHWMLSVRKLRNLTEALALPENILIIEDSKYADEVDLRLRKSMAVNSWIEKNKYERHSNGCHENVK